MKKCLSVVIPCFNEEPRVLTCVARVLSEEVVEEVIVVNDGSVDSTGELLRSIDDSRLLVIDHDVNRGKGTALKTGFSRVSSNFVIVQDADLEQDPADYSRLLGPLFDGSADVVYGTRFFKKKRQSDQQFSHYWANRILTFLSNWKTGLRLTDMETGYKVFRKEVIRSFSIEEQRFGVEPEITAKLAKENWKIVEVPVSYKPRNVEAGKKIGWRDGFRAVFCILKY